MHRPLVQTGETPRSADFLFASRAAYVGLAKLAAGVLGTSTIVNGLPCTPGSGLAVSIGPGEIYSPMALDTAAYGTLSADAHTILKQGVLGDPISLSTPAPTTAGQSIVYLIEAQLQEVDGGSPLVPFYNAANPTVPSYQTLSTIRFDNCALKAKAGAAAPTGQQVAPTVDAGWVPLWTVTVGYGATFIVPQNIAQAQGAPFLTLTLPGVPAAIAAAVAGQTPQTPNGFGAQTNIASAATTDLGSVSSKNALITGTSTISSFGASAATTAPVYLTSFASALQLTNSVNLSLLGNANITTAPGDFALWEYVGPNSGGQWRMVAYFPFAGTDVAGSAASALAAAKAYVNGALGSYLPLIGGTLTGGLGLVDPAQGDYDPTAVSAQWVRRLGMALADSVGHPTSGAVSLTAADMGKAHIAFSGAQTNFVLPDSGTVIPHQLIVIQGNTGTPINVAAPSASYIEGFPASGIALGKGGSVVLMAYGFTSNAGWFVVSVSDPQTLAGKLNLSGGTLSGGLGIAPVPSNAGYTNVLALTPTDYGAGKPGLFAVKLADGSWRLVVADTNGVASTLDLLASNVTVPTKARGTGGASAASCGYADDSATQAALGKINRSGDAMSGVLNVLAPAASDVSQAAVSSAWVHAQIAALLNGETGALATLQGLAQALNQDSNFANDVLAAIGAKLALTGGTLSGQLSVLSTPFSGGYANLAEFGPSDFGPGKASLFIVRPNANANDFRLVTGDPNGVLGTLDLSSQRITVPTVARATTGQSAASMDAARSLGRGFGGQNYYNPLPAALTANDIGKSVLLAAAGSIAMPAPANTTLIAGDTICIETFVAVTLTCPNGAVFYQLGIGNFSNLAIPVNYSVEIYWDGGATWNVRQMGPVLGTGKLQPLPGYPLNIAAGTSTYDLTWAALSYDRLNLAIASFSAAAGTLYASFRDGSGNWTNAAVALGSTSSGGPTGLLISGANTTQPIVLGAGNGAGTSVPALSNGLSGLRISGQSFSATNVLLSGA